ncbi:MAG TPA: PRTRC system ParB family protein [Ramlibacter sp.]|jgi:ParB family chromosome partitioning protein|nr:PRTRC system ParB family protein [Ramlibacter sp.]
MQAFQDGQVAAIRADLIDADFNYRRRYDPQRMASLRADIRARGLIQHLVVRPREDGRFQLIVGNRRYRALVAEFGEQVEVKSEIRLLDDAAATAMMAAENGEREDPSAIEDAELAARMLGVVKGDRDEASRRLGWDRRRFDRRIALMHAVPSVRDAYLQDRIGVGHVEILAALRKDVQERVIEVILQQPVAPGVEQLKAVAEQSLQNLDHAIFERGECQQCQYNTGNQQALFEQSFSGSRCTNRECFGHKTEQELQARAARLQDSYPLVRIVRPGDNSTVIALRADGKRAVGAVQAAACRSCASFGACVSAVPDSLGKVYEEVCFDQACNNAKVAAWRQQNAPAQEPARPAAAVATPPVDTVEPAGNQNAGESTAPSQIRNAVREHREGVWRAVFQAAALQLPPLRSRQLLLALIAHRAGWIDGRAAMAAANQALGVDIPLVTARTRTLVEVLLQLDVHQVEAALQQVAAHVAEDMPIDDVVGLLQALGVKLQQHWCLDERLCTVLTKSELDAVCVEIGLANAIGPPYARLKAGAKKDFIAALLKVQGFDYAGAIPRLMCWDERH